MGISASDLTNMRKMPQAQDWRMAVHVPDAIWTAQVNGAHDRGATTITYDGAVEISSPERYFTLFVGTTAGSNDVATLYFKVKNGATDIDVGYNDVEWADDQHLTILQEVRPWAVLPDLDNLLEDGDENYVDQNTNLQPLARIGPPAAVELDAGAATAYFWSDPIAIASGASITGTNWTFENGNPASSASQGTEDVPIGVSYSAAGFHWVKYVVSDSNTKTNIRYSWVFVWDDDNPGIQQFAIRNLSGSLEDGGWRASIEVFEDATTDEFPEGAQVIIFCKAYWDGSQVDVGHAWGWRENIQFVGWIAENSVTKNPETESVTFELQGIGPFMKNLGCWGAALKDTAPTDPDVTYSDWHVIPDMTLDLAAHHIFTCHTTIDHIADIYIDLSDITIQFVDLTEGDPYTHIRDDIGETGRAVLASNKLGQLYLEHNAQLIEESDRDNLEVLFSMGHADWREQLTLAPELDVDKVSQVDFIGFTYDLTPYGSLAPNRQRSMGKVQKITHVRVADQDEANTYAGLFDGALNNQFNDVRAMMSGFWPCVDVVPQAYIAITLVAGDTNRGLVWDGTNHLIREIVYNIEDRGDACLTDFGLEQDSLGIDGVTNIVPTDEPDAPTPPAPPDIPEPPVPPAETSELTRVIILTNEGVFYTENFEDANPTWAACNNSLSNAEKQSIIEIAYDRTTGYLYMINSSGIYRCADPFNGGAWTQQYNNEHVRTLIDAAGGNCTPSGGGETPGYFSIACDRATSLVVLIAGYNACGTCSSHQRIFYSTDQLTTIVHGDEFDTDSSDGPYTAGPDVQASIENNTGIYTTINSWVQRHGWSHRSTDGGASITNADDALLRTFISACGATAYHGRTNTKVLVYFAGTGAIQSNLYKNNSNGSPGSYATIACGFNVFDSRHAAKANRGNLNYWMVLEDSGSDGRVKKTTDDGGTLGNVTDDPGGAVGVTYCVMDVNQDTLGNDGERFIFGNYLRAEMVSYTVDMCENTSDKTGNLDTWLSSATDYVMQIIPLDSDG